MVIQGGDGHAVTWIDEGRLAISSRHSAALAPQQFRRPRRPVFRIYLVQRRLKPVRCARVNGSGWLPSTIVLRRRENLATQSGCRPMNKVGRTKRDRLDGNRDVDRLPTQRSQG
jgi:hypothetical protein